ncbi:hypothetical protein ABZ840_06685 [Streptomyces sp. NPDC047117]|uniref:hypothetical protein n=1 Tax=Streptomyces sp. NPDC047117 TaxID=3155379 RepID=UPI0033C8A846
MSWCTRVGGIPAASAAPATPAVRLLTLPSQGLDHYHEALVALGTPGTIKVFDEIGRP